MSTASIVRDPADHLFTNFGEQLDAVQQAEITNRGAVDPRLTALNRKAISGGSVTVGGDGGFAVQEDFAREVVEYASLVGALFGRTDRSFQVTENSDRLNFPYIDETSRATGSRWGGVRVYRAAEADSVTASKPTIRSMELEVFELRGLAYMTDRLKRDAPALSGLYVKAFGGDMAWVIDNEILRGTGVGECLGILKSPSLITVLKESGQAANTFSFENAVNMRSRFHAAGRRAGAWYVSQSLEEELSYMVVGVGSAPAYVYANGADPYDRLLGLPVIPIEQSSTLGTVGDIVLADASEYCIVQKGGPSTHFRCTCGTSTTNMPSAFSGA